MLSDTSFNSKPNNNQSSIFGSPQKKALLGKDANIVAKGNKRASFRQYRLLSAAQKMLIEHDIKSKRSGNIHRTRLCHAVRSGVAESISINISPDAANKKASLSGVQTCGSVWSCPVCAKRLAMQRGKEISHTIDAMAKNGYMPLMLTLTARHSLELALFGQKEKFKKSWRYFTQHRQWRELKARFEIQHTIKAVEVTYGVLNGWHYHQHGLLFIHADTLNQIEETELENWVSDLKKLWLKALSRYGLDGNWDNALDLKADGNIKENYLAKLGLEDETTNTKFELSSGHNKNYKGRNIWSILRKASEGDKHSEGLYIEYVKAMSGDNWITYSHGLKDLVKLDEIPEEEVAEEDTSQQFEHLMDISDIEYMPVRKLRAYGDLLEFAGLSKNESAVRQWLVELSMKYQKTQRDDDDARMLEQYQALDKSLEQWRKAYNRRSWQAGKDKKSFLEEQPQWVVDGYKKWNSLRQRLHIRD